MTTFSTNYYVGRIGP